MTENVVDCSPALITVKILFEVFNRKKITSLFYIFIEFSELRL
jgi:hypothetical protein